MATPTIDIVNLDSNRVVRFEIPGGVTTPAEAAEAVEGIRGRLSGPVNVLLTGRGPVWLFAMLAHEAHASRAVATFDPRAGEGGGYVVVASHVADIKIGDIIPDPES